MEDEAVVAERIDIMHFRRVGVYPLAGEVIDGGSVVPVDCRKQFARCRDVDAAWVVAVEREQCLALGVYQCVGAIIIDADDGVAMIKIIGPEV